MRKGSGRMDEYQEVMRMLSNEQFHNAVDAARLDELQRIKELIHDPEKLQEYIREREKVFRNALDKHLNT